MIIRKVAVLGAGTMGAQIAAHFANASVPSLLFDMPGLASAGVEKLKKLDPAPLFDAGLSSSIEPASFETDLPKLKSADWIIEAIVEDIDARRALIKKILPH